VPHFIFSSLYFTSAFLFLLVSAFYFTITLFCFVLFCFVLFQFFFFFGCRCFFRSRLRLASFLVLAAFNFALILLYFCFTFALFLLYFSLFSLYFFYSLQPTSLPRYFFPDSIFFLPIGLQRLFSVYLFRPAFSCMENHLRCVF